MANLKGTRFAHKKTKWVVPAEPVSLLTPCSSWTTLRLRPDELLTAVTHHRSAPRCFSFYLGFTKSAPQDAHSDFSCMV